MTERVQGHVVNRRSYDRRSYVLESRKLFVLIGPDSGDVHTNLNMAPGGLITPL